MRLVHCVSRVRSLDQTSSSIIIGFPDDGQRQTSKHGHSDSPLLPSEIFDELFIVWLMESCNDIICVAEEVLDTIQRFSELSAIAAMRIMTPIAVLNVPMAGVAVCLVLFDFQKFWAPFTWAMASNEVACLILCVLAESRSTNWTWLIYPAFAMSRPWTNFSGGSHNFLVCSSPVLSNSRPSWTLLQLWLWLQIISSVSAFYHSHLQVQNGLGSPMRYSQEQEQRGLLES